jgi:glucose/arabinose dehydrogenase
MKPFTYCLTLLAAATAAAQDPAPAPAAIDAPALYQQHCAQCHGKNLEGGNAQSMLDRIWNFGDSDGYVGRSIKHGITHLGMPAYEAVLSEDEIKALVQFIRQKETEAGFVKPPPPERVQTLDYEVKVDVWVKDLIIPFAIAFADADTALITERPGTLRTVLKGQLQPAPVQGTPEVLAEGQGGLMAVAVDPAYAENGWVYLAYSHALKPAEGQERAPAMTRLVRGHIRDNAWTNEEVIFEAPHESYLDTRVHYGCRIVFDAQGHLYFGIGERGNQDHAQDLARPNGKVHRIWPDGRIPEDNPFADTPGAQKTIYSYGNRNPQGLSFHPETGLLWESEHGPMGGDELNVIRPGANYGWPLITYGRNYNGTPITTSPRADGLQQPALFWRPSTAVCGIAFYHGAQFPRWQNALLVGALKYEQVSVIQVENDRVMHEEVILKNIGRVRDVAPGPDGAIYVITNNPDQILRLSHLADRSY